LNLKGVHFSKKCSSSNQQSTIVKAYDVEVKELREQVLNTNALHKCKDGADEKNLCLKYQKRKCVDFLCIISVGQHYFERNLYGAKEIHPEKGHLLRFQLFLQQPKTQFDCFTTAETLVFGICNSGSTITVTAISVIQFDQLVLVRLNYRGALSLAI
jgi:hypothetical protein